MMSPRKAGAAIDAAVAALISLLVMLFLLGGATYFIDLLRGAIWHIAAISVVAGIAGAFTWRRRRRNSLICGVVVAGLGYSAVYLFAMSRI
jgi:hypothetical protein